MNILLLAMPDVDGGFPPSAMLPPNLGLCSLAGNLDSLHKATIADLVLKRNDVKAALAEALAVSRPDFVGLSALTFQYDSALRTAKLIKSLHPRMPIALGGYHATTMYREIADGPDSAYFDLIFRGESDLSFNEALHAYESGRGMSAVRGVSFKRKGRFVHNPPRPLEDLRSIRLPDRRHRLWKGHQVIGLPFDVAETSRGCLMQCNFCSIRNMYGRSFRKFEMSRIMQDIANARDLGTRALVFTDDNITLDIGHLDRVCQAIIKADFKDIYFGVQASPKGLAASPRTVDLMARAGFKFVFLGIENKFSQNLRKLKKGHRPDDSRTAVRLLRDHGITVSGGLVIGHPDDDSRNIEENFAYLKELQVDFAAVQLLVPYPKTEIREELKKGGFLVNEDNYKAYNGRRANVMTKHLSRDELSYLKYKFTKEYSKPRTSHQLKALASNFRTLYRVFGLGAFSRLAKLAVRAFSEQLRNAMLTERERYAKYVSTEVALNRFNI